MSYKDNRKGILQYLGIPHHEYWSWWLLVIPVWPLWIWYAIRLRCATWFTAVNPGMEDSGFLGESKIKILDAIPDEYKPKTLFFKRDFEINHIEDCLTQSGFQFPLIAKPDIGGRGRKVEIIRSLNALESYVAEIEEDFMIQEIILYEMEFGIFYVRLPHESNGRVTSIAMKHFLSVRGDGIHSLKQLMALDFRASLQIDRLSEKLDLTLIPADGQEILLEPIGNHCRGTSFINRNDLINEKLNDVMDHISKQIDGFYYGRYDLRVNSIEDLYEGRTIMIMELNGLTADAAHIFDPHFRLRDAYRTQIEQCKLSYQIAKEQLKQGVKPTPLRELISKSLHYFRTN